MKTSLLSGLNEEQKKIVRAEFKGSPALREKLAELATKKIESIRTKARSTTAYELASWDKMQADSIGYERALMEIISILREKIN